MGLRGLALALAMVAAAACGTSATSPEDASAPPADAADAFAGDAREASSDAIADAGADALVDASTDAPFDTASDATADAPADAPTFSAPLTLSDPANPSFAPSVATRQNDALVAWHDFVDGGSRVVTRLVQAGVPGPIVPMPDPLGPSQRPWLATTQAGYVMAYVANDGMRDVVRAVELDATGAMTSGPTTISAAGATGEMPHVAASGTQEAFAWTDGSAHYFAERGPIETVPATPVGTTLQSGGILNFPRIALDATGTLLLAYRDGGPQPADWDVLLVVRPPHGAFGAPADVSNSPGLLDDDVAVAVETGGTLDIVWVGQDPVNVVSFEVHYATRSPAGALTVPALFGAQGTGTWMPSVVPGVIAAWNTGGGPVGPFFLATPMMPPAPLAAPEQGNSSALGLEPGGALDFAYVDNGTPKRVRFARRR